MLRLVRTVARLKGSGLLDTYLHDSVGLSGILRQVRGTPFWEIAPTHLAKRLAVRTSSCPRVPLLLQDCCNRDVHPGRIF